ncbi:MAG: DNA lyase [Ignavibacteria bacterium]|nr:DNA lyase [Ignavibacteria bacterium]
MFELQDIYTLYNKYKKEIKEKILFFKNLPKEDYFYELCYCLLTPGSKAQNAEIVVNYLKNKRFFEEGFDPTLVLSGNISNPNQKKIYIRFHNQKAKRLLQARENWKSILCIVQKNIGAIEKRDELVKIVNGFGYKESSHFLRNIGITDVAILDRHILKNLVELKIMESVPKLGTRKKYIEIENLFFNFANFVGIPPEELDLLLWAKETGIVLK